MLASKKTRRGAIGAVVLAGVLAVSGYALTNALTVTDVHNAGDGAGTVATVAVADNTIAYANNATDPSKADTVTFDATSSATILASSKAFVQLITAAGTTTGGSAAAGHWYTCTVTAGSGTATGTFSCDLTGSLLALADVDQFRVVVND
jgi:hypothetical protein